MFEDPVSSTALVCLLIGLLASAVVRVMSVTWLGSLVPPLVFLVSYVRSYQQIPSLPPVGATNKIFYIVVAATLIGILLTALAWAEQVKNGCLVLFPLFSMLWIGVPRFGQFDINLLLVCLGLWLGGAIVLWRLYWVAKARAEDGGGELVGTAMLLALFLGFAPVALLGGSSTSLMLSLAVVTGLAGNILWQLVWPRHDFEIAAVLGGGMGLLAMVDTVTLITQQIDLVALGLLILIPFAGQPASRLILPPRRMRGRVRELLIGVLAATPIALVISVLLLRHPGAFVT